MSRNRSTAEELNTRIEPIELTDDELKAVSGGGGFSANNSNIQNSVNNINKSFNDNNTNSFNDY